MKAIWIFLTAVAASFFSSCHGEKGEPGDTGPQGNANVGYYTFSLARSSFYNYNSSEVWAEPAPSSIPLINGDQAALVYIWMDPVDNNFEWVQQPFAHYFNAGTSFNEFFHGIDGGRLWLYIRNSTGGAPYSNMSSGSFSYHAFIIQSRMLQQMESDGVNTARMEDVTRYFDQHDIIVEAR